MDVSSCLILIGLSYCVLYFFDTFFKTCAHYPYIQFLKGTGLEIKFLQVAWKTTAFNRTLVRWGSGHTKFFNVWFTIGLYVTLVALPIAILLLLATLFNCFFSASNSMGSYLMEPIIPGVNLPASELGYYSATLVICSVFHEMGHAIASVKEDVHVTNVGLNTLLILPIAFVSLSKDDLQKLNHWRALRIFCAGVWHNVVLSGVAFLVYLSLPFLFTPLFHLNSGVSVNYIASYSPLLGPKGLDVGSKVVRINDCAVLDVNTWQECLRNMRFGRPGFCVTADAVHSLDESVPLKHNHNEELDCCRLERTGSVCFEYLEANNGVLEIPPHACLPIRPVVEQAVKFCDGNSQVCPNNLHCIRPLLYNNTNIFKISCTDKDVIYMGYVGDLLHTVAVSSYIPKYIFSNTDFPDVIEKICKYIVIFSLGLAAVNVIPCLAMDGHHISNSILQIIFARRFISEQTLQFISLIIPLCGTLMFTSLVIHTVWVNVVF